jgi:hypothetical protein
MDAGNTGGSLAAGLRLENRASDGSHIIARVVGTQITTNQGAMVEFLGGQVMRIAMSACEFKNRNTSAAADACITGLGVNVRGTILGCYVNDDIHSGGTPLVQPEFLLGLGSIANLKVPQASNDFAACSGGFQA